MHKGIILLTKAENNQEAKSNVEEFLAQYKDDVWDWYQIGGRWNGSLNAKNKEFNDKAKLVLAEHSSNQKEDGTPRDDGFITHSSIKESQSRLQQIWIDLEQSGPNPYCDHYKLPDEGADYDIMLLSDCLNIVADWQQDHIKDGNTELESAKGWLDGTRGTDDYSMYGYSLRIAANIFSQTFCFDCNVFNIHKFNYSVPSDTTGWFAVIIDVHN